MRQMADGRLFMHNGSVAGGGGSRPGAPAVWLSPDGTTHRYPGPSLTNCVSDDDGTLWIPNAGEIEGFDEAGNPRGESVSANGHVLFTSLEAGFVTIYSPSAYCHRPGEASVEVVGASSYGDMNYFPPPGRLPATRDGVFFLPYRRSEGSCGAEALRGALVAWTCDGSSLFAISFRKTGSACARVDEVSAEWTTGGDLVMYVELGSPTQLGSTTGQGVVGVFDGRTGDERWTTYAGPAAGVAAGPMNTVWVAHRGGFAVYDAPTGALIAGVAAD